jgi:hypothetical protein
MVENNVSPANENLRARVNHTGPGIFLLDDHSMYVTEGVDTFAGTGRIFVI